MKLKNTLPLILIGALIGFLGIYYISDICEDYDMSDMMTIESYIELVIYYTLCSILSLQGNVRVVRKLLHS